MTEVSLQQALQLVILYAEQGEPRFEKAAVRWLGMLLLEKPMPISLAAQCVELVSQLRGPEADRVGKALGALTRVLALANECSGRFGPVTAHAIVLLAPLP